MQRIKELSSHIKTVILLVRDHPVNQTFDNIFTIFSIAITSRSSSRQEDWDSSGIQLFLF